MRCKVGDICVMVQSQLPRNIGALFRILDRHRCRLNEWRTEALCDVVTNLGHRSAGSITWEPDACLRPLRDNDGDDETLTWAGRPNETPVEIIEGEKA